LTGKTVTLYDVNQRVIMPFSIDKKLSFVSCLPSTAGDQAPRFFASHWWGESIYDFISCVEQFIRDNAMNNCDEHDRRGGGMTADTPIWVCAYANNQHSLKEDITVDPRDSGFAKAMEVSKGRTITILDKDGVVFTRVWCVFELYMTLVAERAVEGDEADEGLWAVYTAHPHTYTPYYGKEEERAAIGLISGGATADYGLTGHIAAREKEFPFDLIAKSLSIKVQEAEATEKADRTHILNCIAGTGLTDNPPEQHIQYEAVNDALRATFVSSVPSLQAALSKGDEVWSLTLDAMAKGTNPLKMEFDFEDDGWKGMTAEKAVGLIDHLPHTTTRLWINDADFGVEFVESVVNHIRATSKLDDLTLFDTVAGGDDGRKAGARLADAIASNTTLTELELWRTDLLVAENVEEWAAALMKNSTLTELWLDGVEDDVKEKLKKATKSRTPKLDIRLFYCR